MKKIISILLLAAFAMSMTGITASAGRPDMAGPAETACAAETTWPAETAWATETTWPAEPGNTPGKVNTGAVTGLIRDYRLEEGFEVVSVGGLGLGLIRMMAKAAAETEEDKAAIEIMDHLKKIIVVDYDEVEASRKASFERKINAILDKAEKIMEVKDEDDVVNIYGTGSGDGDTIDDIIIYTPGECALICLFGSISSQKIADLIVKANE